MVYKRFYSTNGTGRYRIPVPFSCLVLDRSKAALEHGGSRPGPSQAWLVGPRPNCDIHRRHQGSVDHESRATSVCLGRSDKNKFHVRMGSSRSTPRQYNIFLVLYGFERAAMTSSPVFQGTVLVCAVYTSLRSF